MSWRWASGWLGLPTAANPFAPVPSSQFSILSVLATTGSVFFALKVMLQFRAAPACSLFVAAASQPQLAHVLFFYIIILSVSNALEVQLKSLLCIC